jgi:hypothetical protein
VNAGSEGTAGASVVGSLEWIVAGLVFVEGGTSGGGRTSGLSWPSLFTLNVLSPFPPCVGDGPSRGDVASDEPESRPDVTPLRITLKLFLSTGMASTPANNAPLSVASAAFLALFSSLAASPSGSAPDFFVSPRVLRQPRGLSSSMSSTSPGGGTGSNGNGSRMVRPLVLPDSTSRSMATSFSSSSASIEVAPALDREPAPPPPPDLRLAFRRSRSASESLSSVLSPPAAGPGVRDENHIPLDRVFFLPSVEPEYWDEGESPPLPLRSLRLRRVGIARTGGTRPWVLARKPREGDASGEEGPA